MDTRRSRRGGTPALSGARRGLGWVRHDLGDLGGVSPRGERGSRSGGSLLWLGRARLRGGDASHIELDQEFAVHFLIRGEKIVRFRGFREWQHGLEAARIQE